jgi:signal transduction histidine kinase
LSKQASLRARLLAGTLAWIVASLLIAGWGLGNLFHQHVELQFHHELQTHLDQLAANLQQDEEGELSLKIPLSDPRLSRPHSGLYWQVDRNIQRQDAAGLLRSRSLWDGTLAVPLDSPANGEIHHHRILGPTGTPLAMIERIVTLDDAATPPAPSFRLIVAADERLMLAPVADFNDALWLALAVLGIGLISAAIFQVRVGLAPLQRLRQGLEAVREGKTQQLAGDFPSEIRPLVEEFNTVLAQNTEVVTRARTHAGNLAHAVKTPLSVLANAASNTEGDFAQLVRRQVSAAKRQVDYHLSRARTAATIHIPGVRTPLQPTVEGLARLMRHVHADRQIELQVQPIASDLTFRGEEQDLQEMLGNLLDNACKWARQRIEIQTVFADGKLTLHIDDDGPGIAPGLRDEMITRGARADEQTPGSGLGLAIVDDLARLYGGRIELSDSPLGGLRASLSLPAGKPQD